MTDFQAFAAQFINSTGTHIFLTGKAGTGKTTFLKNLRNVTHKNFIVVAPTGIAALNAGGVTIHSQFMLPPLTFLPDRHLPGSFNDNSRLINQNMLARQQPLNSARKQVLRSIDLLVIDEVSMLRADLLDAIDYRLKAARGNFKQSFGGVQVLFIGDLYQLPPVVSAEEQQALSRYYKSSWFYEAKALEHDKPVYIEFDKIFRQHDMAFINVLNNLRNNTVSAADIELLNQRYKTAEEIRALTEVITLTTHNYKADELNQRELKALATPSHFFDARIEGEFPESMYPVAPRLELKVGAQIMFTRNDTDLVKAYVNGQLATIKKIENDDISVLMAGTNHSYQLKRERWENKKYAVTTNTRDLEEEVIGSFEQFPVKLAWAITIHKSQGLTFDKAIIDVGQAFAAGQVYVALSRLRSLEGLILRTRIHPSVISTDTEVVGFSQAHHQPHRLADLMQEKQKVYLRQLMEATFDFSPLAKDIQYALRDKKEEGSETLGISVLEKLADALQQEKANTEKFRRQLIELLEIGNTPLLVERLTKGRAYYNNVLFAWVRQLLEHIEAVKQQKRVKTYLTRLNDLDQALTKKWEEVDKVSVLGEKIIRGESHFNFDVLKHERQQARLAMLAGLQKNQPGAKVVRKRTNRQSKRNSGERSTFDITLEMFKLGMSIEQIAKERGLVPGTIEGHLAKAVETARLDIGALLCAEELAEINDAIQHLPNGFGSKELFDKLQGKYGYGKLRAVMASRKPMT